MRTLWPFDFTTRPPAHIETCFAVAVMSLLIFAQIKTAKRETDETFPVPACRHLVVTNIYTTLLQVLWGSRPAKKLADRNLAVFPWLADIFKSLFRRSRCTAMALGRGEIFYLKFFPDSGDVSINLLKRSLSPFGPRSRTRILSVLRGCLSHIGCLKKNIHDFFLNSTCWILQDFYLQDRNSDSWLLASLFFPSLVP